MNTQELQTQEREVEIAALRQLWFEVLPSVEPPDKAQFFLWLRLCNDFTTVCYGIVAAAKKRLRMNRTMSTDHAIRYASAAMNNLRRERAKTGGSSAEGNRSTVQEITTNTKTAHCAEEKKQAA